MRAVCTEFTATLTDDPGRALTDCPCRRVGQGAIAIGRVPHEVSVRVDLQRSRSGFGLWDSATMTSDARGRCPAQARGVMIEPAAVGARRRRGGHRTRRVSSRARLPAAGSTRRELSTIQNTAHGCVGLDLQHDGILGSTASAAVRLEPKGSPRVVRFAARRLHPLPPLDTRRQPVGFVCGGVSAIPEGLAPVRGGEVVLRSLASTTSPRSAARISRSPSIGRREKRAMSNTTTPPVAPDSSLPISRSHAGRRTRGFQPDLQPAPALAGPAGPGSPPGIVGHVSGRHRLVQRREGLDARDWGEVSASEPADLALDPALLCALLRCRAGRRTSRSRSGCAADEPLVLRPGPTQQHPDHRRGQVDAPMDVKPPMGARCRARLAG